MSGKIKKKVDVKDKISIFLRRTDEKGNTLLHQVAKTDNVEFAKQLIAAGCDVNAENTSGSSPLICAIRKGQVKMVEILLNSGAFYDDSQPHSFGLLHCAVRYGWPNIVKLLLKAGADVNARNKWQKDTPLHVACHHFCQIKSDAYCLIIKTLIDAGADLNAKNEHNETPLKKSVETNCGQVFELLLSMGANIYKNEKEIDNSLIDSAIYSDNLIVLERLIELGYDVNWTDVEGDSCLHLAAGFSNHKTVEYLLKKGAAINIVNKNGFDPMSKAMVDWYEGLDFGSDVDDENEMEYADNEIKCLELLIKHGADVNRIVNDYTSLYVALDGFEYGRSFIKILLKNGATFDFDHPIVRKVIDDPDKSKFLHLLLRHEAIFKAQNRTDGPTNFHVMKLNSESRKDYARCRDELELMKATKIEDSNVSFFHILVNPDIGPYTRNESITNAFETLDISKRFPIYSDLLTERFFKEIEFQRLVNKATENLAYILHWDKSSENIVLSKIVNYLDKEGLTNLSLILDKL